MFFKKKSIFSLFLRLTASVIPITVISSFLFLANFSSAASIVIAPGDLIKGSNPEVYLLGDDLRRYVFPSEEIYYSWYSDFSGVNIIPDESLADISLAGNITYRQGAQLIRVESLMKLYILDSGSTLREVSEETAEDIYGTNWKLLIKEVPVTLWADYTEGPILEKSEDFQVEEVIASAPDIISAWGNWPTIKDRPADLIKSATSTLEFIVDDIVIEEVSTSTEQLLDLDTEEATSTSALPDGTSGGGTSGGGSSSSSDITAPTISNITVSNITISSAVISFDTDEDTTTELSYGTDESNLDNTTSTSVYAASTAITITGLTYDTTYYYQITVQDSAGNSTESDVGSFSTDITAPTISNITVSNITISSAVISFDTDENTTTELSYGTDESNLDNTTSTSVYAASTAITITGLTYDTTYYYQITVQDSAGNAQTSAMQSFDTQVFRFVHMTDTHIITAGDPRPSAEDGRTDNCLATSTSPYYLRHFPEFVSYCNDDDGSELPTIAFTDAVTLTNTLNPEFTIITGDLVPQGAFDQNKIDSIDKFKEIADGLDKEYYIILAAIHDMIFGEYDSPEYFESQFGALNWHFTNGDNLFIGLTENFYGGEFVADPTYDLTFLTNILETYANQDMNVFIFLHIIPRPPGPFSFGGGEFRALMESYATSYKSRVGMYGHVHSNRYEFSSDTHWIGTTAIMNYPTEFRIIDIYKDRIEIYMSDIVSTEVNNVSETMVEWYISEGILKKAAPPLTKEGLAGDASERSITISLP